MRGSVALVSDCICLVPCSTSHARKVLHIGRGKCREGSPGMLQALPASQTSPRTREAPAADSASVLRSARPDEQPSYDSCATPGGGCSHSTIAEGSQSVVRLWPCATHWTVCRRRGASGNRTDAEPSPHPDIEIIGELAARMRCDIDPDKHPLIREYCRRKTHGTFLPRKRCSCCRPGNMKIKNRSNLLFYVLNGHLDVWRQRQRMDGNSSTEANRLAVRAAGRASPVGAQWRLPHSARSSPLAFWTASGMPSEGVARS
jgi:hypothetical protein